MLETTLLLTKPYAMAFHRAQCSVLCYIPYILGLYICRKHGVKYHLYADDIQLYLESRDNVDFSSKIAAIECCIEDLMAWMRSNLLKVNSDKTEFILFRTRFSSSLSPSPIGCLRSLNIPPYIKSLGVYFDCTMSMSK